MVSPAELETSPEGAATLPSHPKLPDELCALESIPRSAGGKIDRVALLALVVEGNLPRVRMRRRVTTGASPT